VRRAQEDAAGEADGDAEAMDMEQEAAAPAPAVPRGRRRRVPLQIYRCLDVAVAHLRAAVAPPAALWSADNAGALRSAGARRASFGLRADADARVRDSQSQEDASQGLLDDLAADVAPLLQAGEDAMEADDAAAAAAAGDEDEDAFDGDDNGSLAAVASNGPVAHRSLTEVIAAHSERIRKLTNSVLAAAKAQVAPVRPAPRAPRARPQKEPCCGV
jgi:hypothetical protein